MQAVGYRQFINRNLPLRDRACSSKVVFVSRGEAKSLVRHGRQGYAGLKPYRSHGATDGTSDMHGGSTEPMTAIRAVQWAV